MAYVIYTLKDVIRVPPNKFKEDLSGSVLDIVREEYEGIVDEDLGVLIAATKVNEIGEGKIVLGDGGVWYEASFDMLAFKPEMHEVMEGEISEITEFGAFIRTGPVEGLIHVSQIMDDFIVYDQKTPSFIGKETGRKIKVEDNVLARVVTISLKGNTSKSKIGLTMRQPFLGSEEWRLKKVAAKKTREQGQKQQKQERLEKPAAKSK